MLGPPFAPGALDQDAAHGLRSRGKKVSPAVPVLRLLDVHEPDVGFVDQGRGLERLARRFFGHLLAGELAQLIID